jgi:hypothetical protein
MSDAALPDDELMRQPHQNEEIPRQDVAASADALQPETQDADPLDAELGEMGQGDLLPEDEPSATGDGPDGLRVTDEP